MDEQKFELFVKMPALMNKLGITADNIISIVIGSLEAEVLLKKGDAFEHFEGINFVPFKEPIQDHKGCYSIIIEGVKFSWL